MNDTVIYVQFTAATHSSYDSDYAHFTARPLVWAKERSVDQDHTGLFSPDSYSIDVPQSVRDLAGLEISGQVDERIGSDWYGWHVGYRRDLVELRDAEAMLKVLRKIDRAMTKIASEYGRPNDIASYATHAVKPFAGHGRVFIRDLRTSEPDYDSTGYRYMDTDGLRWWLEDETAKWHKLRGHATAE